DENGTLLPLPESEREVNEIKALFLDKDPIPIATNLRSYATEAALKENLQQPYRYIHIAGHSFADLNNPLFSGIACYPDADNDPNSTMLYMGEIYLLKTQADLIILSSCESGFGQALDSDGLVGLNRAFIISGTPNVVFSLWKVYDKVSAEMMIQFYRGVIDGADYASSLRDAKLRLINDPATASPHYWSPFLMIGR
ncbi:MAG: CHAT domain-containing protein, partial [Bacteroidota bacterium]